MEKVGALRGHHLFFYLAAGLLFEDIRLRKKSARFSRMMGFNSFVFLVGAADAIQGSCWTSIPPMSLGAPWPVLPKEMAARIPSLAALSSFFVSGGFQSLQPLWMALMSPT